MVDSVNVERLREATLDDADFMGELVEMFVTDVADQIVSLERSIASEDWQSTSRTAHRLRGASSNVGADKLASLCSELEHNSAQTQAVDSSAGKCIREEFERVRTRLQDVVLQAKSEEK